MRSTDLSDISVEKYLEVLQFLLDEEEGANNEQLGKVKLFKLLYYADFDHFQKHGTSITGDTYRKLDYGPVPRHGADMLKALSDQELVTMSVEPVIDYARHRFRLTKPFQGFKHLSRDEQNTLRAIVNKWKHHSRGEIVLASHGDPPWQMVEYGDDIPYGLVYYREDVVAAKDDEEPEPRSIRQVS